MPTIATDNQVYRQREAIGLERYEAYEMWKQMQDQDPELASVRMLYEDLQAHGSIRSETWQRFRDEELTYGAEVLDISQVRVDRFKFDGTDIIVKESDGVNPQVTLREVYAKGLDDPVYGSRAKVHNEPGLAFQVRRDEYFWGAYQAVELMMRRQTEYDTIRMTSTCPSAPELAEELIEMGLCADQSAALQKAKQLLEQEHYNEAQGKSYQYIFRRLPNGELEMVSARLDNSNLQAHDAVIRNVYKCDDAPLALLRSHERGRFLGFSNTTDHSIRAVVAESVKVYDEEMQAITGKLYRYGRTTESIDAEEFFTQACPEYWEAYKGYHERLAQHLAGEPLDMGLKTYLLQALAGQEAAGMSVLKSDEIKRLRAQLMQGRLTPDMVRPCKKFMTYNHHATMDDLLQQQRATGDVVHLSSEVGSDGAMAEYGEVAGGLGAMAAAEGKSYDGCQTGNEVSQLSQAMELAQTLGTSVEQALNILDQRQKVPHNASLQEKYGAENVRKGTCGACGKDGEVGPCGPGFCNACDTRDRQRPGYILRLYQQRQASEKSQKRALVDTPSLSVEQQNPQVGDVMVQPNGTKHELREKIVVGGTVRYWADFVTGEVIEGLN